MKYPKYWAVVKLEYNKGLSKELFKEIFKILSRSFLFGNVHTKQFFFGVVVYLPAIDIYGR